MVECAISGEILRVSNHDLQWRIVRNRGWRTISRVQMKENWFSHGWIRSSSRGGNTEDYEGGRTRPPASSRSPELPERRTTAKCRDSSAKLSPCDADTKWRIVALMTVGGVEIPSVECYHYNADDVIRPSPVVHDCVCFFFIAGHTWEDKSSALALPFSEGWLTPVVRRFGFGAFGRRLRARTWFASERPPGARIRLNLIARTSSSLRCGSRSIAASSFAPAGMLRSSLWRRHVTQTRLAPYVTGGGVRQGTVSGPSIFSALEQVIVVYPGTGVPGENI